MRRSRRRTRKRSRRQRGGFLDALKAGLVNGLNAVGLKKKEENATAIQSTPASADLSPPLQEGGKRRRRKSSRRRKSRKSRRTKRRTRTKRRR